MDFKETLTGMVQAVDGAQYCTLVGYDGIEVDRFGCAQKTFDPGTLLVEYCAAFSNTLRGLNSTEQESLGAVEDLVLCNQKLTTVFRPLTDEYMVVMIMKSEALVGKARFVLRTQAPLLTAEL